MKKKKKSKGHGGAAESAQGSASTGTSEATPSPTAEQASDAENMSAMEMKVTYPEPEEGGEAVASKKKLGKRGKIILSVILSVCLLLGVLIGVGLLRDCINERKYNEILENGYTTPNGRDLYLVSVDPSFSGEYVVATEFLDMPVVGIEASAFDGCTQITSVVIHDGIEFIEDSAFRGCTSLSYVDLPDGLTDIRAELFFGCESLSSIALPDGISAIGASAFEGTGITEITIPAVTTEIGTRAFANAPLAQIHFAEGDSALEVIGKEAFLNCALEEFVAPEQLDMIDASAFDGCTALKSVSLNDELREIGAYAFRGCSLSQIIIPISVTTVGEGIFSSGSEPLTVYLDFTKDWLSGWGWRDDWCGGVDATVYYTDGLPFLYVVDPTTNTATITSTRDTASASVSVPLSIGGYRVGAIGDGAFENHSEIKTLVLPDSIVNIGERAFSGCDGLEAITIPYGVESIGTGAFDDCHVSIHCEAETVGAAWSDGWNGTCQIDFDYVDFTRTTEGLEFSTNAEYATVIGYSGEWTRITIPKEYDGKPVLGIAKEAFKGSNVVAVYIPDSVKTIGEGAFSRCPSLHTVQLPSSLSVIEENLFYNSASLTDVTVPEGVSAIGDYAFAYCGLTDLIIPDSVSTIGGFAFRGCSALSNVLLPRALDSLGVGAFDNCSSLVFTENDGLIYIGSQDNPYLVLMGASEDAITTVNVNNNTQFIHYKAFKDATSLETLVLSESLRTIDAYAFEGCVNLATIYFEEGLSLILESAFSGCTALSTLVLPESMRTIDARAFAGCSGIVSLNLGNGVASIGAYAFSDCTSLVSLTLGTGLREVDTEAFGACNALTSVHITDIAAFCAIDFSDSINTILSYHGSNPLYYAEYLYLNGTLVEDLVLDGEITRVDDLAFYYYPSLKSVTIGAGVVSIGAYAFGACQNLESITVHADNANYCSVDGVLYSKDQKTLIQYPIGKSAEEFTVPATVTEIASFAFAYFDGEMAITIGGGVSKIGYGAFQCNGSLTLQCRAESAPEGWDSGWNTSSHPVVWGWFDGDTDEQGVTYSFDDTTMTATVSGYTGSGGTVVIPETVKGYTVRAIGDSAFYGCTTLTDVTIPDSVSTIGEGAFSGCSSLVSVTIPDGVSAIGADAFRNCSKLTGVIIPDGVSTIGEHTFLGCSSLKSMTIPDSVSTIGNAAFSGCIGLKSLTLGNGVSTIGYYAFAYCSGLTSVTVPDSVTEIGEQAFYGCSGLTSVTIGRGVSTIDSGAFSDCPYIARVYITDLGAWCNIEFGNESANPLHGDVELYVDGARVQNLVIPDGVSAIGAYAFYHCAGLTGVTVPDGVTDIGKYAFYECTDLAGVTIGNGVSSVGDRAFYGCSGLTSVKIGDSVTSIGAYAFYGCTSLTSVTIPDSVDSLDIYAFSGCSSLKSVTLGNGVSSIGNQAFSGCTSLVSVPLGDGVSSIGYQAFSGCTRLASVMIPIGVSSIGWNAFEGCSALTVYCAAESQPEGWVDGWNGECSVVWGWFEGDTDAQGITYSFDDTAMTATVTGYSGSASTVTIPAMAKGYTVTAIGDNAFAGCTALVSVTIPESVSSIGNYAFNYCYRLAEVINHSSLNITVGSVDPGCVALWASEVHTDAQSRIVNVNDYLFYTCGGVNYLVGYTGEDNVLVLPDDYNGESYEIRKHAFYNCMPLVSVTISAGVSAIGNSAFSGCHRLVEVINHSSLSVEAGSTDYGYVAHYAKEIHTGNDSKVAYVNDYIFYTYGGVNYLVGYRAEDTELVLPDDYNGESYEINQYAFYNCKNLTSVTVSAGVSAIGKYAFRRCTSLTGVHITDLAAWCTISFAGHYSNPLYYAKKLSLNGVYVTELAIPDGITSISSFAFVSCTDLTSLTIPDTVSTIGESAFSSCTALTSVTIPDTQRIFILTASL